MYRIKQYHISPRNSSFEKVIKVNIRVAESKLEQLRTKLAFKHNRKKSDIIIVKHELMPKFLKNRYNTLNLKKRKNDGKGNINIKKRLQI